MFALLMIVYTMTFLLVCMYWWLVTCTYYGAQSMSLSSACKGAFFLDTSECLTSACLCGPCILVRQTDVSVLVYSSSVYLGLLIPSSRRLILWTACPTHTICRHIVMRSQTLVFVSTFRQIPCSIHVCVDPPGWKHQKDVKQLFQYKYSKFPEFPKFLNPQATLKILCNIFLTINFF